MLLITRLVVVSRRKRKWRGSTKKEEEVKGKKDQAKKLKAGHLFLSLSLSQLP